MQFRDINNNSSVEKISRPVPASSSAVNALSVDDRHSFSTICEEWKNYSEPVLQCERSVRLKTMLVLGLSQETSQHKVLDRHDSVQSVIQMFSFSFVSIKGCISGTQIKKSSMTRLSLQKNSYTSGPKSKL